MEEGWDGGCLPSVCARGCERASDLLRARDGLSTSYASENSVCLWGAARFPSRTLNSFKSHWVLLLGVYEYIVFI